LGKRKKVASVMFTGAAATAMVGAAVQPAAAQASNWTITPGGPIMIQNATNLLLAWDTSFGWFSLNCPPSTGDATGSMVTSATGASPQIGTISTATFGAAAQPCSLFGFGMVLTLDNPIGLHATGSPLDGVTPGRLGPNVNLTLKGVGGFNCDMHMTGSTVPVAYDSNPDSSSQFGVLAVNPALSRTMHVDRVSGCSLGGIPLFPVSTPFGFQADMTVRPKQTISHN
jgi:hypothetical protein